MSSSTEEWLSPSSIQEWWTTPSQSSLNRPYSADTVASLRDAFPENHHSNVMALKLREVFERAQKEGRVNLGLGVVDARSLELFKEAGLKTAYVSAQSYSTSSDSGSDITEHTSYTIPKRVQSLYRSQLHHSRTARLVAGQDQSNYASPDIIPLIADAGSGAESGLGHDHIAIMKLVKLFVQSGVAGIHIDDSLVGSRETDGEEVKVIVPMNEFLRRLTSVKLQLDVMGSEIVSIARTDAATATHITSTIDARDRPFILSATRPLSHDYVHCEGRSGQDEWKREAHLLSLDEAFKLHTTTSSITGVYERYLVETRGMNTSEAFRVAENLSPGFYWNSESPRTVEGYYPYRGGVDAAISRSVNVAPVADVVWACSHSYDETEAEKFALEVQGKWPGKWMAYDINLVGKAADEDNTIKAIPAKLASLGYIWQLLPLTNPVSLKLINHDPLTTYLNHIVRPAGKNVHHDGTSSEWWWKVMGKLADTSADAIGEKLNKQ
ncbi:isocitrate lyase [Kwoniella shandongensis]|uniref:methylisocitrate lyase n=1 Tax=Kwoniella shandongensis TaxID=1734106 RepID=A0A5M6BUN0_9TREE|nr:isocitrate lyase [Kwoniella shandongensis]KAA5526576.1 isocitrate lyase [Kwoniella shandongensis]